MQLSETSRLRHRKNLLFVNKRKQKNFVYFYQKFFASFFQKDAPFLFCNRLISLFVVMNII